MVALYFYMIIVMSVTLFSGFMIYVEMSLMIEHGVRSVHLERFSDDS